MYPNLIQTIEGLDLSSIPSQRKEILKVLAAFIQKKKGEGAPILLNFICTHNSRRSHLSQVWAQALAAYFNVENLFCYSGGTEATTVFPMVIKTLINQGFSNSNLSQQTNPIYALGFGPNSPSIVAFSKKYDHPFNPEESFAAIMTCDTADQGCPFIAGAEKRIALPFEDPKVSDGTPEQEATYAARSLQIACELKYVFSQIT